MAEIRECGEGAMAYEAVPFLVKARPFAPKDEYSEWAG
jgi:hypothetical protein